MNNNRKKEVNKGSGSYGYVNKVTDLDLGIVYAEKHLNLLNVSLKDKRRFIKEYSIMHKYNHENLVRSYSIDKERYTYIMDYCDSTLSNYIRANNTKLSFENRINLALQFLNGMKYIHDNKVLHRDLSYNNVLIRKYDDSVKVKISDFGLAKDLNEPLTSTRSDKNRGTFRDPLLEEFRKYSIQNEMYSIGFILHLIFRGKRSLNLEEETNIQLKKIIQKCTTTESLSKRYHSVNELVSDIHLLSNISIIEKKKERNDAEYDILEKAYYSKDSDGIWYDQDIDGRHIYIDNKTISLDKMSLREKEKYIFALDNLLKKGLIRLEVDEYNTKQYFLTEQGYLYFEQIRKDN